MYTYQETKDASILKHHIHALWPWWPCLSFSNSVWAYPLFEVLNFKITFTIYTNKKITFTVYWKKKKKRRARKAMVSGLEEDQLTHMNATS